LIKTINGELNSHLLDQLILSVEDRQDIRVWDKNLSSALNNDLMKCVSAYVSLHRSEGLGLNILEAMQVKVPVIVTAYGGNMDFCNYGNSFLIPFELVPVEDRSYLYPPLGCWAEADVDAAALAMTSIAQSEEVVETKKEEALITVENLIKNNKFPLFIEKILADLTFRNKQNQVGKHSLEYLLKKLSKIQRNLVVKSRDYLKIK
jgi:glycosyltransferase involved in cell wall biosynthesis